MLLQVAEESKASTGSCSTHQPAGGGQPLVFFPTLHAALSAASPGYKELYQQQLMQKLESLAVQRKPTNDDGSDSSDSDHPA